MKIIISLVFLALIYLEISYSSSSTSDKSKSKFFSKYLSCLWPTSSESKLKRIENKSQSKKLKIEKPAKLPALTNEGSITQNSTTTSSDPRILQIQTNLKRNSQIFQQMGGASTTKGLSLLTENGFLMSQLKYLQARIDKDKEKEKSAVREINHYKDIVKKPKSSRQ